MNQLTKTNNHPLAKFAERFDIDAHEMENVLKSTCFRQKENVNISNEQMVALMAVAQQYDLNPFLKQIYAFPDKSGGIVPVVGIDGWLKIINKHPEYDGMKIEYSESEVQIDEHAKPCPEYIDCTLYRKDRQHQTAIREHLDECYKPPYVNKSNGYVSQGPWQSHPKRFLRHKAIIQAARVVFNITGIYDEDEAQRIIEREVNPEFKVTDRPPHQPAPDYEDVPIEEETASRTDELVSKIQNKKSQNPIEENKNESRDINKKSSSDKKTEKSVLDKPKKMTLKQKNDLLERIEQCFNIQQLNGMVPELSQYEEKSTHMMELRAAWSARKDAIKNNEKTVTQY